MQHKSRNRAFIVIDIYTTHVSQWRRPDFFAGDSSSQVPRKLDLEKNRGVAPCRYTPPNSQVLTI